jgi:hypothetical protein
MSDHNLKQPLQVRPLVEASSHSGAGKKQKTVRTTVTESELIIVQHQREGWLFVKDVQQGGNEILLIFER